MENISGQLMEVRRVRSIKTYFICMRTGIERTLQLATRPGTSGIYGIFRRQDLGHK